ncbi:MAG TPA: TolC family outer membrane protein [Noviherbaspirillum sp.]
MSALFPKRALASALSVALLVQAGQASAIGLVQAYEAALQNDPTYRAAVHENEAGQQNRIMGRANLLPSISMSVSRYENHAEITQSNILGQRQTTNPEYPSKSGVLQLRQPILNMDGLARYRQSIAQSNYSESIFALRTKDLVVRLVGAYADAKFAEDQLALTLAQRDTLAEQRLVNERMFQKGEGTKTDMLETQARYDVAEAQVLEARNNVTTARNTLASIIGGEVQELDGLSDDFRIMAMTPATFDEWKAIALESNPDIIALRYSVEAAEQEIAKQRAGHAPRVDLVASINKSDSDTISTRNQESTVRAVGVQINIPIYSGGSVSAATSQAASNHERAKAELIAKTNQVLVELRKQFDQVHSSAAKIEAMGKALNSARALVQATQQSIKGGVRINLDLLNAQQQVYAAQRDLAQARYNYLISYLRLRFAAGTLTTEDLHTVAKYFVGGAQTDVMSRASLPVVKVGMKAPVVKPSAETAKKAVAVGASTPKAADAINAEVLGAVEAWAKAWSARDVQGYLAHYAADFRPAKGMSRDAWMTERRSRIEGKSSIAVKVDAPEVGVSGDTATVKFRQIYKSDRLTENSHKVLLLEKQGGAWKIRQESVIR